jgi:glycosyltransferase involved in cell wall biosynthesis
MPRILFDARAIADSGANASGGIGRVAARLLAHLQRTRSTDRITTITTGWNRDPSAAASSTLHLPLPNKLWSLCCFLGITSLDRAGSFLAKKSFDELILPNVGFVGTPHIPYTVAVHDLSFLIEPSWFPWKMRLWHKAVRAKRLIQNAKNIWCVSETTARDVEQLLGVPREHIAVLTPLIVTGQQNNAAPQPSLTTYDPTSLRPYVLAFGGNNPRKNISTIIAAVARVREYAPFQNMQLRIIGPCGIDMPPWVLASPSVSDSERDDLYRHASALLYPSWYEGFGLPIHEAARFNIPILASAHGALPETAPPGTILINPAKPHLWAAALRELLAK